MRFKVGDVVKCVDDKYAGGGSAPVLGESYKVAEATDAGVQLVGFKDWWYVNDRFEKVSSDPWAEVVGGADEVQGLKRQLDRIQNLMNDRQKKYGPGNIAEFGDFGILVRMADKFARLKNGQQDHNDETVRDTLDDVIGYSLIWLLWLDGVWPGSPNDPFASRDDAR